MEVGIELPTTKWVASKVKKKKKRFKTMCYFQMAWRVHWRDAEGARIVDMTLGTSEMPNPYHTLTPVWVVPHT